MLPASGSSMRLDPPGALRCALRLRKLGFVTCFVGHFGAVLADKLYIGFAGGGK